MAEHIDLNKLERTQRGFAVLNFADRYGVKCSIQESSLATEAAIWFGVDDAEPKIMATNAAAYGLNVGDGTGWVPFPIPDEVLLSTRMHLTQDQVVALLPLLQRFAETGELFSRAEPSVAAEGPDPILDKLCDPPYGAPDLYARLVRFFRAELPLVQQQGKIVEWVEVIASTAAHEAEKFGYRAALASPAVSQKYVATVDDPTGDRWHSLTCDGTCSPPCVDAATTASASGPKPCPFCDDADPILMPNEGEQGIGRSIGHPHVDAHYMHCENCGADGPAHGTEYEARGAWNRRAQDLSRDAATKIKTWRERLPDGIRFCPSLTEMQPAKDAEITDLRAALANSGASHAANAGEDAERDAKRYRWLRQADWDDITSLYWSPQVQHAGTPDACMLALDDAIDAAIASSAEQETNVASQVHPESALPSKRLDEF